jgi:hypothetical protein
VVEQHLAERRLLQARVVPLKKTKARHFTLLPEKSGFTVSYIPICRRFMVSLVSKLKHDGRPVEKFTGGRELLSSVRRCGRSCNLNAVETKTRSFHRRFLTDGCVHRFSPTQASPRTVNTNEPWNPKLLNGKKKVGYSGTDRASLMSRPSHTSRSWMVKSAYGNIILQLSRYYEAARSSSVLVGRRDGTRTPPTSTSC